MKKYANAIRIVAVNLIVSIVLLGGIEFNFQHWGHEKQDKLIIGDLLELNRAVAEDIGVGGLRSDLSARLVLMLREIAFEILGSLFDRGIALRRAC
jgi:hypothetical protein